jgi:hypothetical protein
VSPRLRRIAQLNCAVFLYFRHVLEITPDGRRILAERRDPGHDHLADLIDDRLTAADQDQVATSLTLPRRLLD